MARIALSPPGRFGPRTVILPAAAPANGRPFLRAPLQERALRSGGWRPASFIWTSGTAEASNSGPLSTASLFQRSKRASPARGRGEITLLHGKPAS